MKYLILVHHDEEAFGKMPEEKRQEMLAESVQLTHQLHDHGQYVHASPLHPAGTGVIVRVREGKQFVTDGLDTNAWRDAPPPVYLRCLGCRFTNDCSTNN